MDTTSDLGLENLVNVLHHFAFGDQSSTSLNSNQHDSASPGCSSNLLSIKKLKNRSHLNSNNNNNHNSSTKNKNLNLNQCDCKCDKTKLLEECQNSIQLEQDLELEEDDDE